MDTLNESIDSISSHWQLILNINLAVVAVYVLIVLARIIINRRHLFARNMIWLEITPPASIAKTPEATQQLFSVLHGKPVS